MTGAAFRAYIEQALAPALQPGDVVVMDNLAEHKMAGISEPIGVSIDSIELNSPAERSLQVGDIVVAINGRPIDDSERFVDQIGRCAVGEPTGAPGSVKVANLSGGIAGARNLVERLAGRSDDGGAERGERR